MAEIRLERKNPFYVCAHLLVSNDLISISRNLLRENKLIRKLEAKVDSISFVNINF